MYAQVKQNKKPSFAKQLSLVQEAGEDFEWYPTTQEMISVIAADLKEKAGILDDSLPSSSVLDCGAGDGRVLSQLTKGKKYAIEKSTVLITNLPEDIFIVGTDFNSSVLLDKKCDVIFSNPPYSEYESWATKIITEGNAQLAYLILPERWIDCESIHLAIESRRGDYESIGKFNFFDADRKARGTVEIICVSLCYRFYNRDHDRKSIVDPFELWFETHFDIRVNEDEKTESDIKKGVEAEANAKINQKNEIVIHKGLVVALEEAYQEQLAHLVSNYQAIGNLDPILLGMIGVNLKSVKESLKLKITSLKDIYWKKLFDCFDVITTRLTSEKRKMLTDKLFSHTHVDFTFDNVQAIVMWVIKNANSYFDSQLIDCVVRMTDKANVCLYKSNKRTFGNENWRYLSQQGLISDYGLEYRIVLNCVGGIAFKDGQPVISSSARDWILDLCAVAYNIGFDTYYTNQEPRNLDWADRGAKCFTFRNIQTGEIETLFEMRAYQNGNLHIKFNQKFICKLNVEFGRLKGWVKSAAHAADELNITLDDAEAAFGCHSKLEGKVFKHLLTAA